MEQMVEDIPEDTRNSSELQCYDVDILFPRWSAVQGTRPSSHYVEVVLLQIL